LHRLQAVGTLLYVMRSPFTGRSEALGDGEVSRFAFATCLNACANARGRKSAFVEPSERPCKC